MNKLQLRKELKRIGDRNRRFKAMTKARKRVAIAKDTIEALNARKIVAKCGVYLAHDAELNGDKLPNDYACKACALGSMFVGLTTRVKDLSVKGHQCRSHITEDLSKYFSDIQLDMVESAFEQREMGWAHSYKTRPAKEFGNKYSDSDDRLRAIMQNIIDNNGTFKP